MKQALGETDMELKKWTRDWINDLARFANNKKIADNVRNVFPHPYTSEDAEQYIDFCLNAPVDKQLFFAIVVDSRAVGSIGITLGSDVHAKSAEIGYWLGEEYWNRGLATKAIREMCRTAFSRYDIVRIFAEVFADNAGSCKALEKSGFLMEGRLRKSVFKNGRYLDSLIFGLIR